jgi:hypothetical protein
MRNIKELTNDYLYWSEFREIKRAYLTNDEYKRICEIYARLNEQYVNYPCKCSPKVIQSYIDFINESYDK